MRTGLLYSLAIGFGLLVAVGTQVSSAFADSSTPKEGDAKDAYAPKEGEKKSAEKKDAAHGEKDKTAFMGIKRYDLAIYTLIVFGLLFVILGKYAWKPIIDGLEKRENVIFLARADAEKAREEAEKLLAEVKAQRAKANEEITAVLAEARRDADVYREAEKARAAADIQAERDRLKREIETARDQALKEIWDKTVQLSTLVSSKAIGRIVSSEDHRRLVDESLTELQQLIKA
ncbi:MAG: ATP synthase F0 subunit B [Planctomycetes bacterium]|nr:ATP synthase F0 subunit B [Planctomycetota bacterium]